MEGYPKIAVNRDQRQKPIEGGLPRTLLILFRSVDTQNIHRRLVPFAGWWIFTVAGQGGLAVF